MGGTDLLGTLSSNPSKLSVRFRAGEEKHVVFRLQGDAMEMKQEALI